jgi:hypothetical protein
MSAINKLEQILTSMNTSDLRKAVFELDELSSTGVLATGVVREVAKKIEVSLGIPSADARNLIESHVLRVAAMLWAKS